MDFYSSFINMQRKTRIAFRLYRSIDMAVLCVLAPNPERAFSFQQIADALDVAYHTAWNSVRRLELNRLVEMTPGRACRLTQEGIELMRLDDVTAQATSAASPSELY